MAEGLRTTWEGGVCPSVVTCVCSVVIVTVVVWPSSAGQGHDQAGGMAVCEMPGTTMTVTLPPGGGCLPGMVIASDGRGMFPGSVVVIVTVSCCAGAPPGMIIIVAGEPGSGAAIEGIPVEPGVNVIVTVP